MKTAKFLDRSRRWAEELDRLAEEMHEFVDDSATLKTAHAIEHAASCAAAAVHIVRRAEDACEGSELIP